MAWELIEASAAPLTVNIEAFEGPLDLLLHLIKKNQIDIADIPIALITRQYLEYLELMRSLDISIAGEYLEMAATLLFIKSRMLLPARDQQEQSRGGTQDDPREILKAPLETLIEVKGLATWLNERPILGRDVYSRGKEVLIPQDPFEISMGDLTLYDLFVAYTGVLDRKKKRLPLVLGTRGFRIEDEVERVKERLAASHQVSFLDLLTGNERSHIVTLFMAVLQLAKEGAIRLVQREDGELIIFSSGSSSLQAQVARAQM